MTPPISPQIAQAGLANPGAATGKTLLFLRGSGPHVWDESQEIYVDCILGYGSVVLGHAVPEFIEMLVKAANLGNMLPGYTPLHREFLETVAPGDTQTAFFKSGSEAVTAALRISAHATTRMGVIRCGFLGWHDALLGRSPRWHESPASLLRYDLRYRGQFRGLAGQEKVWNWTSLEMDELRDELERSAELYGAFVLDLYQTRYLGPKALAKAVSLARSYGLIVVADETKTIGRVCPEGVFPQSGLAPDLTISGKAIANGYPLSLLTGTPELMRFVEEARITGTFAHEVSGVAAALATRQIMESRNGYSRLQEIGRRIACTIESGFQDAGAGGMVSCQAIFGGSMIELDFGEAQMPDLTLRRSLVALLAARGVLLLQGHPSYVSLSHDEVDLDMLREASAQACARWLADYSANGPQRG